MSKRVSAITLTCPPHIHWVKDSGQILVVNEKKGAARILRGFEAAVWDYLMLGYSFPRLTATLGMLLDIPAREMEQKLAACLRNWQAGGLLEAGEASHV